MQHIFVIIRAGCEGIDGMLYASLSREETVNHLKQLRRNILHDKARMEAVLAIKGNEEGSNYEDEWDRMYYREEINDEEHSNAKFNNPDDICIQEWDGKEFKCACPESGVAPSENICM